MFFFLYVLGFFCVLSNACFDDDTLHKNLSNQTKRSALKCAHFFDQAKVSSKWFVSSTFARKCSLMNAHIKRDVDGFSTVPKGSQSRQMWFVLSRKINDDLSSKSAISSSTRRNMYRNSHKQYSLLNTQKLFYSIKGELFHWIGRVVTICGLKTKIFFLKKSAMIELVYEHYRNILT